MNRVTNRELYTQQTGQGKPVVLLHGMAASGRYWDKLVKLLEQNYSVLTIDLLGFGRSPKPANCGYLLSDHTEAVWEAIDRSGIEGPVTMVGHSAGALIAAAAAAERPKAVKALIMLGPPVYPGARAFRKSLKVRSRLWMYGPLAWLVCNTVCRLRPVSGHLAAFWLDLPAEVARDSVLHTWRSYSLTLRNVVEGQRLEKNLGSLSMPIVIVYGENDRFSSLVAYEKLKSLSPLVEVIQLGGGHHLALTEPEIVQSIIADKLA